MAVYAGNVLSFDQNIKTKKLLKDNNVDWKNLPKGTVEKITQVVKSRANFKGSLVIAILAYIEQGWEPEEIEKLLP